MIILLCCFLNNPDFLLYVAVLFKLVRILNKVFKNNNAHAKLLFSGCVCCVLLLVVELIRSPTNISCELNITFLFLEYCEVIIRCSSKPWWLVVNQRSKTTTEHRRRKQVCLTAGVVVG